MTTTEQIEDFIRFAKRISNEEGAEVPLVVIFDRWHTELYKDQDLLSIQASHRDFEQGERGRPIAEFLQEFDAQHSTENSK